VSRPAGENAHVGMLFGCSSHYVDGGEETHLAGVEGVREVGDRFTNQKDTGRQILDIISYNADVVLCSPVQQLHNVGAFFQGTIPVVTVAELLAGGSHFAINLRRFPLRNDSWHQEIGVFHVFLNT
jgi:hypothetical protein